MSKKPRRGRGSGQEAVDDLLQTLVQDGAASVGPASGKDGRGTLADASLTNVDRFLDRVSTRRQQAEERRAAAEPNAGGRKRKPVASSGPGPLFSQPGFGRTLRRRTSESDAVACGAPAQSAHSLEHGERSIETKNGFGSEAGQVSGESGLNGVAGLDAGLRNGLRLEDGSEDGFVDGFDDGFGEGFGDGFGNGLDSLEGQPDDRLRNGLRNGLRNRLHELDDSFESGARRLENGLGAGFKSGLTPGLSNGTEVLEGVRATLSAELTLTDADLETPRRKALCLEDEHWEEGFGHATPGSTGPSTDAFAGWSGQVAIDTGDDEEELGKPRAKPALRRATARDKEFAALIHKAHLLCLLARGIRFDVAADDSLLQASLLSCAPEALGALSCQGDVITGQQLTPLVNWFQKRVTVLEAEGKTRGGGVELCGMESHAGKLQEALEKGGGTAEEVSALFVAMCRSLGLTTRFVSILDATPLKPDAASLEASLDWDPDIEDDDSQILYTRGGAAVAQMLRQLPAPPQSISKEVFKAVAPNGIVNGSKPANGILAKGGVGSGGKGKEPGWKGSAKVVDAGPAKGKGLGQGKGKRPGAEEETTGGKVGARQGGGRGKRKETGGGRGRGKRRGNEPEEESAGHGAGPKLEDLSEEEQLAQAIAASLGEDVSPPPGGKAKRAKEGGEEREKPGECHVADSALIERRRKGDEELELQLQIAMAATAIEAAEKTHVGKTHVSPSGLARLARGEAPVRAGRKDANGFAGSGAVWSRRRGIPLHWAEVYCGGGKGGGGWVHVDPVRGVVDAPQGVESATAGGKQALRYVVAFAGGGAKDISRRYVARWSAVMPLRIDTDWWEETLNPLRRLEAAATSGRLPAQPPGFKKGFTSPTNLSNAGAASPTLASGITTLDTTTPGGSGSGLCSPDGVNGLAPKRKAPTIAVHDERAQKVFTQPEDDRAAREDVEMETRTLTEPLPTNQQAYKSHHLYALERWLTKYQVLHPKGPVLGFCAGQPVYPRTSVQVIHTADRWLREGRKVQRGALPVKVLKTSKLSSASDAAEQVALGEEGEEAGATSALFGRWQTDAWRPPPAKYGKVPRNERGQVDVWNESFLPGGTVHLRFPRIVQVARRLKVDYAPAMVGFEVRGGRSAPKFDGIVICKEFERQVLEVYLEEEQRLHARELWKREQEAALRWRQLLKAVALRQRLRTTYEHNPPPALPADAPPTDDKPEPVPVSDGKDGPATCPEANPADRGLKRRPAVDEQHDHVFPEADQTYDSDTGVRKKRCPCGFVLCLEEM